MLSKQDYAMVFGELVKAYNIFAKLTETHKDFKKETFTLYYKYLNSFSKESLSGGIDLLIRTRTSPFFPTVAEVIKYTKEFECSGLDKETLTDIEKVNELLGLQKPKGKEVACAIC